MAAAPGPNSPSAFFTGPLSRAAVVHGGAHAVMVGVALLPAGWSLLTGRSAADYVDSLHSLSDLVEEGAGELVDALIAAGDDDAFAGILDAWLLARRPRGRRSIRSWRRPMSGSRTRRSPRWPIGRTGWVAPRAIWSV